MSRKRLAEVTKEPCPGSEDEIREARERIRKGLALSLLIFAVAALAAWIEDDPLFLLLALAGLPGFAHLVKEWARPDRFLTPPLRSRPTRIPTPDEIRRSLPPPGHSRAERVVTIQDQIDLMEGPRSRFGIRATVAGMAAGFLGAAGWLAAGLAGLLIAHEPLAPLFCLLPATGFGLLGGFLFRQERARALALETLRTAMDEALAARDPKLVEKTALLRGSEPSIDAE